MKGKQSSLYIFFELVSYIKGWELITKNILYMPKNYVRTMLKSQAMGSYEVESMKAFNRELSLVAMKYVPPTSVQLTLFDQ